MTHLAWTLLKFGLGAAFALVVGALPPELITWLSGWRDAGPDNDRSTPIRYGKRRRFRRRAT